jgi:phosphate transport system substrate-binding protein
VIVGKEDASRGDYTSSEDDNVIVTGVAGDEGALGFLGLAFFQSNTDRLKAVPIDDGREENGSGPQAPSAKNVLEGRYQPLSRPLFIYVRGDALARPEVSSFISFYLANVRELAAEVEYIPLPDNVASLVQARFKAQATGSLYQGDASKTAMSLEQLLR